jgi:hypothetical protein
MSGAIPALSQCASMAWISFKKHRDNFTLVFLKKSKLNLSAV